MKKYLTIFIFVFSISIASAAQRLHPEKYYQNLWAKQHNATTEYILPDKTRVDCVTNIYAIEVDFANKWAEAVGQSLYYALCLNKKPAVVLIMENH